MPRFLCLPGGYNNSKTLIAQLHPLCEDLESDNSASFVFTQGTHPARPPVGYDDFFGPAPHFRFLEHVGAEDEIFHNLRQMTRAADADATIRGLLAHRKNHTETPDVRGALDALLETMDCEGDIEGIIGYSEGAAMAATLLLEEQRIHKSLGRQPRIKWAIFFSGWPPLDSETGKVMLFEDTHEQLIQIPTIHVIGTIDPFIDGCMALYNLCDTETADIFDHGGGHIVPRDKKTLQELGNMVRDMVYSSSSDEE